MIHTSWVTYLSSLKKEEGVQNVMDAEIFYNTGSMLGGPWQVTYINSSPIKWAMILVDCKEKVKMCIHKPVHQ